MWPAVSSAVLDFGEWEPRQPHFVIPEPTAALELDLTVLDGIGPRRAETLMRGGVQRWVDLWSEPFVVPPHLRSRVMRSIERSYNALAATDIDYFSQTVSRREWWRVAATFPRRAVFLDIETTGLSRVYHEITIVGWSRNDHFDAVSSENRSRSLQSLSDALQDAVLVTFNGAHFDVPFMRDHLPSIAIPVMHIDLRHLARRAGYLGGQKLVEATLGLARADSLVGVSGEAAPALWFHYQRGDLDALELLMRYNHADVEGMKVILEAVATALDSRVNIKFPTSSFDEWTPRRGREAIRAYTGHVGPRRRRRDLRLESGLKIIGIDLTGSEKRLTGWADVTDGEATTRLLRTDDEILSATVEARPALVSIDAPLSLPRGRTRVTDDDPEFAAGIVRVAERTLWSRGVSAYPALIRSMQGLTARGIALAAALRARGIPVIESYPGAKQDILGMPRKGVSLDALKLCIVEYGIAGDFVADKVTHDEIDAISSAVVGQMFLAGEYEAIGDPDEGLMIVPRVGGVAIQRRLIAIAGPTAAGKTTLAAMLENLGASRARFSETIARLRAASDRDTLRLAGAEMYESGGQRALNAAVYGSLDERRVCVVDGVRYAEDVAYAREWAGSGATLVYLHTSPGVRARRYAQRGDSFVHMDVADQAQSERDLPLIQAIATVTYNNDGSITELEQFARQLLEGTD